MIELKDWYHAYVIEGEEASALKALKEFFLSQNILVNGNPDYTLHQTELFSIEDSQRFIKMSSMRSTGGKKIFVSAFQTITHEAQNALLKLFEEPPTDTHYFMIVPSLSLLLPTVRSRVMTVRHERRHERVVEDRVSPIEKEVIKFVDASKAERIGMVKDIISDRTHTNLFLDALERYIAGNKAGNKKAKTKEVLEALYLVRKYIRDRGASPKMLLEYFALISP